MATPNTATRIAATATDLAVLNAKTTGAVVMRQTEVMGEVVQISVAQAKALWKVRSFGEAVLAQEAFLRTLGNTLRDAGRDNWSTVRTAGGNAFEVVKTTFRQEADAARTAAETAVSEARETALRTVQTVASKVEDAVASKTDVASKSDVAPKSTATKSTSGTKNTKSTAKSAAGKAAA